VRLGGETCLEDGIEQQEEEFLENAVLERGRRVDEPGFELAPGGGGEQRAAAVEARGCGRRRTRRARAVARGLRGVADQR
jgi:hypothetical protein